METTTKPGVKEILWPGKTFIIKRAKLNFNKLPAFFAESYGAIYHAIQATGVKATEPPCAIYYSVDEIKMETDIAAAISVQSTEQEVKGFEKLNIPASKALFLTHYGPYENMRSSYDLLEKYIVDHKLQKQWVIEQYFTDPAVEKDPNKWKTDIYFIVK